MHAYIIIVKHATNTVLCKQQCNKKSSLKAVLVAANASKAKSTIYKTLSSFSGSTRPHQNNIEDYKCTILMQEYGRACS